MLNQDEVASIMKSEVPKLLQARIDELEYQLKNLIYCAENNSGYAPSLCCYQHALCESKKTLSKGVSL